VRCDPGIPSAFDRCWGCDATVLSNPQSSGAVNGGQGEPSVIGTNKRVAKADFRYFDDKHNFDCWDTTRNTTSLLLVLQ